MSHKDVPGKALVHFGCRQDHCIVLDGIMTLLLSLFSD